MSAIQNQNLLILKYGCNPHQIPAKAILPDSGPLEILNGNPGYINLLDAIGAWQLANELKIATGKTGAASFKHVSPAGAAIARPVDKIFLKSQFLPENNYSDSALAYIRARAGDRMCSYGDAAAVSGTVDITLANVLKNEVSDLIIAPEYDKEALDILKAKKKGKYTILRIDPSYIPPEIETKEIFGLTLEQKRNDLIFKKENIKNIVTKNKNINDEILETIITASTSLKYTQSNSVCAAIDGQLIGVGAGQQSRVHCTRLTCDKAEKWMLQHHPKTLNLKFKPDLKRPEMANIVDQYLLWDQLSDVEKKYMMNNLVQEPEPISMEERFEWFKEYNNIVLSSDAFFPFRDNIDRAAKINTKYIIEPGGSIRDDDVIKAADEYQMVMAFTGIRCFLH